MKMNMLVCVKQVPDTTEIKINPETNTLIREGVPNVVNPYDAYALETAARVKDKHPGSKIVVISMGPKQAKNALKECLSVGADRAYLVSDRVFGGSDTLATSYVLFGAVKKLEELEGKFDLIFCGKQAIDGDTAQVGPELAEYLDWPQITYGIEVSVEEDLVKVKRETDAGYNLTAAAMPCLLTITKPFFEPRYPTIKSKVAAHRAEIPTLTSADFALDTTRCGLKGSPTKVKKIYVPAVKGGGTILCESDCAASAKKLVALLADAAVI